MTEAASKSQQLMVRLSPEIGALVREIAREEERSYTVVILRALRLYAEQNGYTWPSASKHLPHRSYEG